MPVCPLARPRAARDRAGGSPSKGEAEGGGAGPGRVEVKRSEVKASLAPYRQASAEIMRALASGLGPGCLMEKAGIGENGGRGRVPEALLGRHGP